MELIFFPAAKRSVLEYVLEYVESTRVRTSIRVRTRDIPVVLECTYVVRTYVQAAEGRSRVI